jgi:hypothetical protein
VVKVLEIGNLGVLLKDSKNAIKKKKFEIGTPKVLDLLVGSLALKGFKKRN